MNAYRIQFTTLSGQEDCLEYHAQNFREARKMFEEDFGTAVKVDYIDMIEEDYDQLTDGDRDDEYDGQPDEAQEWYDFDPEC